MLESTGFGLKADLKGLIRYIKKFESFSFQPEKLNVKEEQ